MTCGGRGEGRGGEEREGRGGKRREGERREIGEDKGENEHRDMEEKLSK